MKDSGIDYPYVKVFENDTIICLSVMTMVLLVKSAVTKSNFPF